MVKSVWDQTVRRYECSRFRRQRWDEVAQALGVKSILTGRVLRHGENLQMGVDLMDARDKAQVWGSF